MTLDYFRFSLPVLRAASERRGRNGLDVISGTWGSRTERVCSTRSGTFKDAARAARVSEELHDALTGHAGSSVGRTYGAKDMVRRFGLETLADAVNKIRYPGLDLTDLFWTRAVTARLVSIA